MLELKNIYKTYRTKNGVTHRALNNVSLNFDEKGLVFIVGKSGSGKSTLLNVLGALDGYERGDVIIDGKSFNTFTKQEKDAYRNTIIGFVFQEYNLIDTLTVKENLGLALSLQHIDDNGRINEVIEKLDLKDLEKRKPHELSGGQQQRVSIARALIKNPKIILADEPTGSLDSKTGKEIFRILKELSKEKLVIVITHDRENAEEIGDRVIEIKDGLIYKDLVKIDEAIEQQEIDVIGSSIIRIPKEKELDDETVEKINDIVYHNGKDNYVIVEQDSRKIKSMYPQLRNAIKDETKKDVSNFVPYRKKEEEPKNIEFIKSSLPLKNGFKISLSNLKYKKIRLTFTIIMMIFAVTIMGFITSITDFDYPRAVSMTIKKENIPNLMLEQTTEYVNQNEFSAKDIENLKTVYGGPISNYFEKTMIASMKISDNNIRTIPDFTGYTEIDNVADLGFTSAIGADTVSDFNSVIITDYIADKLVTAYQIVENAESLIGMKITLEEKDLTIAGIIKTDYHKYDILSEPEDSLDMMEMEKRNNLKNHLLNEEKNTYNVAYVKKGYINNVPFIKGDTGINFKSGMSKQFMSDYLKENLIPETDIVRFYEKGKDDIIVSIDIINSYLAEKNMPGYNPDNITEQDKAGIKTIIDEINSEKTNIDFYVKDSKVLAYINTAGRIIGYFNSNHPSGIIVDDEVFSALSMKEKAVYNIIVKTSNKKSDNVKLFRYMEDNKIGLVSYYQDYYKNHMDMLKELKNILTALNVFITLLVVVLFFNFISSSIKLNKKKVGIIRALGARKIDTFKIFAWEGGIISVFSLIVSLLLLIILTPSINAFASNLKTVFIPFIVFTPKSVFSMILLSILITALAISLPLRKFSKLKPIDAIIDK